MFTVENIMNLITKLLIILPDFTFRFLSVLMKMDEDILRNGLTPKELLDIIQEFWKMNELESFFEQMKPILKGVTAIIGFKEQLPSVSKLELAKEISSKITT